MKAILRKVVLPVVFFAVSVTVSAQKNHYHYEAGFNLGTLIYQGDLVVSDMGSFKGAAPMLQLWAGKPFSPYFSWRANLTFGSIDGDDARFATPFWKRYRNFNFHSPVTELSGVLQYNIYGDNDKDSYHTLTPYFFAGLGLTKLNIRRDWSRLDSSVDGESYIRKGLVIDSLHKLPSVLAVLPVGAGLKWMVTPRLSLNAELGFRLTMTDYLDGFSYSANPKKKDAYYSVSLGLGFVLGSDGLKCPQVRTK
jgi:hypothetical protein